jgi:hypothetical protein
MPRQWRDTTNQKNRTGRLLNPELYFRIKGAIQDIAQWRTVKTIPTVKESSPVKNTRSLIASLVLEKACLAPTPSYIANFAPNV